MSKFIAFAIAALVTVGLASGEVHSLDESNFDTFIQSQDASLVKFYAPWCGHCKALAPEYEKAANLLNGKAKIAEVDCTQDAAKALCEKYGVRGYPTVKYIGKDGSVSEYDEARTADGIVSFITLQTSPAYIVAKTADELAEALKTPMELLVVLHDAEDSTKAKELIKIAQSLRKQAAIIIDTTKTTGDIVLHRKFDEPEVKFEGKVTQDELVKFVNTNSLPLIGEIGPQNYKKYVEKNLPLTWIFIDYEDAAQVKALEDIKAVAKDAQDILVFAKLDGSKWAQHAQSFGLTSSTPGIAIEDRVTRKKYAYPKSVITVDDFKAFVEGFRAKTLTPIFRSEDVPAKNDAPVTVAVGKTFQQLVVDGPEDVFVEFYAPWCGHCKKLAPEYDTLGEHYANDANVKIVKIDATANDFDTPFQVTGFPTLYFYPGGKKSSPVRYNGDRTADALKEFIEKNRTTKPTEAKQAVDNKDEL